MTTWLYPLWISTSTIVSDERLRPATRVWTPLLLGPASKRLLRHTKTAPRTTIVALAKRRSRLYWTSKTWSCATIGHPPKRRVAFNQLLECAAQTRTVPVRRRIVNIWSTPTRSTRKTAWNRWKLTRTWTNSRRCNTLCCWYFYCAQCLW